MKTQLITFTSDFGEGSPYVAQMKAVALAVNPQATLVDITHAIEPQDIRTAAVVLADVAPRFPKTTMHVCVVDPGVGTERKIVYARLGSQQFVAPDNGLLSLIARQSPPAEMFAIESREFWQEHVSRTFHGRDIMTPVAAHVSRGVAPERLGSPHPRLIQLDWPDVRSGPGTLDGSILLIDRFGNLITNIGRSMLPADPYARPVRVACRGSVCQALVETYGAADPGTLVALIGSNERLEIAVSRASAAEALAARVGDTVQVRWEP